MYSNMGENFVSLTDVLKFKNTNLNIYTKTDKADKADSTDFQLL